MVWWRVYSETVNVCEWFGGEFTLRQEVCVCEWSGGGFAVRQEVYVNGLVEGLQ